MKSPVIETTVPNTREMLGLLRRSTRCHSLHVSKLFNMREDEIWTNMANNYLNSRKLVRLLFPAFRAWFEIMDYGGQDWRSSFMAKQGDMEFEAGDGAYHMSWDRSDFGEEIDRLLQNAEGMWMGTLDGWCC
ncbi:hypothetical protein E2P81_ATG06332 [Venturia nashicola]|uniref:Uncharacterized protein n=1 Tax=Venturia nashicola TaxID=86259 RepID=A0A4Z1PBQ1_9PEZI|nr:hypothetical protein E6O75_ATG06484 [Venturia nashicola]TLD27986.1 hypothetical protein E2P81_ATG06332 [Venturia nashicola]